MWQGRLKEHARVHYDDCQGQIADRDAQAVPEECTDEQPDGQANRQAGDRQGKVVQSKSSQKQKGVHKQKEMARGKGVSDDRVESDKGQTKFRKPEKHRVVSDNMKKKCVNLT